VDQRLERPGVRLRLRRRLRRRLDDIEAAREELVGRDIEVGDVFHALPAEPPQRARDGPHRRLCSDPRGTYFPIYATGDPN
jgi:hypothetical protein